MRHKGIVLITLLSLLGLFISFGLAQAQSPEIDSGVGYLTTTQNADGSWGSVSSSTDALTATAEGVEALTVLGMTNAASYSASSIWLSSQDISLTGYLSHRILALSSTGTDVQTLSSYIDTLEYAWGGYEGYDINMLDTALAMRALESAGAMDAETLAYAIYYVFTSQNDDGGWGFSEGNPSNTYLTALVMETIKPYVQYIDTANALQKAKSYLLAHQNADGGFGSSPSTVYGTAVAYIALLGQTTDQTVLGSAVNYLKAAQGTDGSWENDPWQTALALQALNLSEDNPAEPEPPVDTTVPPVVIPDDPAPTGDPVPGATSSTLTGQVTDYTTGAPIEGATVTVNGTALSAQTVADGSYTIAGIEQLDFTVTVSASGYLSRADLPVSTTGFGTYTMNIVLVSSISSTLSGTVVDAETGQPISGASVSIEGTAFSTASGADGTFSLSGIDMLSFTLTVSASGYITGSSPFQFSQHGLYETQIPLQPGSEPQGEPDNGATSTTLSGIVTDGETGAPIAGATVIVDGTSLTAQTASDGSYTISDIGELEFSITASADGYHARSYTVSMTGYGSYTVNMTLDAKVPTAITGVVTDEDTGEPIEGASVVIQASGMTAKTDTDGAYTLNGLTDLDGVQKIIGGVTYLYINIQVSATGYSSVLYSIAAEQDAATRQDYTLDASKFRDMRLSNLKTDGDSFGRDSDVVITATVENLGDEAVEGFLAAQILDSSGEIVAIKSTVERHDTFEPFSSIDVEINWNTAQFSPGRYKIAVGFVEEYTENGVTSSVKLYDEGATFINITPSPYLTGGLTADPPATHPSFNEPVNFSATLRNSGNVPLNTVLALDVAKNGISVYHNEQELSGFEANKITKLDFGGFTPVEGGTYTVRLKPLDTEVEYVINDASVLVGDHVTSEFVVYPAEVPSGTAHVTANIHLTGRGDVSGASENPLVPIVKDAIQKAVNYEQPAYTDWINNNQKCYGCHVQPQAAIGLELASKIARVDRKLVDGIFAQLALWQQGNGSEGSGHHYNFETQTPFALWAFSVWSDEDLAVRYLLKAADYAVNTQHSDGSWNGDSGETWWFFPSPASAAKGAPSAPFTTYNIIGITKAYKVSGDQKYLDSLLKAAAFLKSPSWYLKDVIVASNAAISLGEIDSVVTDETLRDEISNAMSDIFEYLKDSQRSDGGWARYPGDVIYDYWNHGNKTRVGPGSDPLISAQVIYAYKRIGVSITDASYSRGITYLLNSQGPDGSWQSALMETKLSTTTWVIVALPISLEDYAFTNAEVHVTFSNDVSLESSREPVETGAESESVWGINGIDGSGKDILLGLSVDNLAPDEERPIAEEAFVRIESDRIKNMTLFEDDFSADSGDWTFSSSGSPVQYEDGELSFQGPRKTGVSAMTGDDSWVDYTAKVDVIPQSGSWRAGIRIRTNSQGGGMLFHSGKDGLMVYRQNGSNNRLFSKSISIGNGRHSLSVKVKGNFYLFYFNDELVFQTIDTTFPSGGVSLSGWGDGYSSYHVHFDNFVLTSDVLEYADIPISIPSIKGIAPVKIDVETDKAEYHANEDVHIDSALTNLSYEMRSTPVEIIVEDKDGHEVAQVASFMSDNIEPSGLAGWAYRIPVTVSSPSVMNNEISKVEIDFEDVLDDLGVADSTIDENSIRVLEFEGDGDITGEKLVNTMFESPTKARITWLLDGTTDQQIPRHFWIYFDTLEKGMKTPAWQAELYSKRIIAYLDDHGKLATIESYSKGMGAVVFNKPVSVGSICCDTRGVTVNDFNNDGYMDIIAGSNSRESVLYYFSNKADGTDSYETPVTISDFPSGWTMDMASADFNKDGNQDFVVSKSDKNLYLFLGNGDGTFSQASMPSIGESVQLRGKDAADIDGDGDIDLIVGAYPGKLYLFKNNGDGSFNDAILLSTVGDNPYGVVAGDFDNDGLLDIIFNHGIEGDSYFLKGQGNASFNDPVLIPSLDTNNHSSFEVGDLNSDGNLDIIATTYKGKTVLFYPGNGDGSFGSPSALGTTFSYTLGASIAPRAELITTVETPENVHSKEYSFTWNTGTTLAGDYRVHGMLTENGEVVAEDYADFTILPDAGTSSSISTDKIAYSANEDVAISSSVTNEGSNVLLEDLTARIVIKSGSDVLYTEDHAIAMMVPGQRVDLKTYWNTAEHEKGTYTAVIEVLKGNVQLSTSSASFEILGSANTGAGLLGALTASPELVKRGEDETLMYTVENQGNEDITGLAIRVIVVNPETQEALETFEATADLAKGTTVVDNFTESTSALGAGVYIAVLEAQTAEMAEPRTLAQDTFEVEAPSVEASKSFGTRGQHVLVWLNYNWTSASQQQALPDVALVEQALQAAGVSYVIVYDKKDFQDELRSPFYTDYMILGDHHPLEDHYSSSLREKVFGGRGLISSLFNRHNLDGPVFGVKVTGYLARGDYPVELGLSDISAEGLMQSSGRSLKAQAQDETQVAAWVVQETKRGTLQHPAIVERSYGLGNVLFYAFDLGLSTGDYEQFESLIVNSLAYVHQPEDTSGAFHPYQLVPVDLALTSTGDDLDVLVEEQYPDTFRLFDPSSWSWVEDNPWVLDVFVDEGQETTVGYYALTPDQNGTFTLLSTVGIVDEGEYTYVLDSDIEITVMDTYALTTEALDMVQALTVSPEDETLVTDAITLIQGTQSRVVMAADDIETNIHDILQAIEDLLAVTSTDTSDAVHLLDGVLKAWEGRAYFGM